MIVDQRRPSIFRAPALDSAHSFKTFKQPNKRLPIVSLQKDDSNGSSHVVRVEPHESSPKRTLQNEQLRPEEASFHLVDSSFSQLLESGKSDYRTDRLLHLDGPFRSTL